MKNIFFPSGGAIYGNRLEGKEDVAHHVSWGYTMGETTKMPQFWIIAASFIFIGFYNLYNRYSLLVVRGAFIISHFCFQIYIT